MLTLRFITRFGSKKFNGIVKVSIVSLLRLSKIVKNEKPLTEVFSIYPVRVNIWFHIGEVVSLFMSDSWVSLAILSLYSIDGDQASSTLGEGRPCSLRLFKGRPSADLIVASIIQGVSL